MDIRTRAEIALHVADEDIRKTFQMRTSPVSVVQESTNGPVDIPGVEISVYDDDFLEKDVEDESVDEEELFRATSLPCGTSLDHGYLEVDQQSLISTSLSSRMELEVTSKTLKQWKRTHTSEEAAYQTWDFSEVADAVDNTASMLSEGRIQASVPERTGVSGTYFFRKVDSSANVLGVFKPADEEVQLEPTDLDSAKSSASVLKYIRHSFHSGEGLYKEQAAYLLDHERFSKVPQTTIARCDITMNDGRTKKTKTGAFQVYVENVGDTDDYGPGVFCVEDVQRIAIFDIRTFNCDRHAGNILVCKNGSKLDPKKYGLVPIDHGYILPDRIVACPWPAWMDWPQSRQPLSNEAKEYVSRLDGEHDAHMLKEQLKGAINDGSFCTLKIGTLLLTKGVEKGLSLFDIGSLVFVKDPKDSSFLEKTWNEAYSVGYARQARRACNGAGSDFVGDKYSYANIAEHSALLPETESFIIKYTARLIGTKVESLATRSARLDRVRSTPLLSALS
uniref:PI3K/PI4K catalytic domain-containing protein n=1 Tax=Rhodosorus marinus TaxID=101924 RepID=A0A6T6KWJ0_9RHOD|mmetsp:Transcript_13072/g.18817  ORF Transcript_13072/g.18817 Transcript_13072/m.18817 type:complete len:505 (+) Transcript_13072:144-1658(+)